MIIMLFACSYDSSAAMCIQYVSIRTCKAGHEDDQREEHAHDSNHRHGDRRCRDRR